MIKILIAIILVTGSFLAGYLFRDQVIKMESPSEPLKGYEIILRIPTTKEELRRQILLNHAQASILNDLEKWWKEAPKK